MSVRYVGVQWNKFKIVYDVVAIASALAFIAAYEAVSVATHHGRDEITPPILDMRAFGACAFLMLSVILALGPLARLAPRFRSLVYNRRHLGVAMAAVGVLHAVKVLGYYDEYGRVRPLVALLTNDVTVSSSTVPFQLFGAAALLILVVMAATSHDFWQRFLGARAWKALHMSVYLAYALVVAHVAFGALQDERSPVLTIGFVVIVLGVAVLHVLAARASSRADTVAPVIERAGTAWLDAGPVNAIPIDRARPVCGARGERIAVIRTKGKVSALHGVCAHQGGPLDEGRIIDGSLTCPWHGWQYRPEDGCSPPPFQEKLATYRVKIEGGRVYVDPRPHAPGDAPPPVDEAGDGAPAKEAAE